MDARDRLRRYLEQRRELGESELVLDHLSVDDVMRLVGAKSTVAKTSAPAAQASQATTVDVNPRSPEDSRNAPDAPESKPLAPPPEPGVRFDPAATTDWRAALSVAGVTRPGVAVPKPSVSATTPPPSDPPAHPLAGAELPATGIGPMGPLADASVGDWPAWLSALDLPRGLDAQRPLAGTEPDGGRPSLAQLAEQVAGCTGCALHTSAHGPVFGEGNATADLLCVGDAPGAEEAECGTPFAGEAGELLTKILGAIQLSRSDVYLCNVLKHRPLRTGDPSPEEITACWPYLLRQIEIVRPRVILALGRVAAQTMLHTTTGIGALRGHLHRFHGVPLIVTYHPSALLRNEAWKRPTWEDVKLARRILDASRAAGADTTTL